MDQEKIARINELARKAKSPQGLTPQETAEREALRREYVAAYRKNLEAQLESIRIVEPDGAQRRLNKREP